MSGRGMTRWGLRDHEDPDPDSEVGVSDGRVVGPPVTADVSDGHPLGTHWSLRWEVGVALEERPQKSVRLRLVEDQREEVGVPPRSEASEVGELDLRERRSRLTGVNGDGALVEHLPEFEAPVHGVLILGGHRGDHDLMSRREPEQSEAVAVDGLLAVGRSREEAHPRPREGEGAAGLDRLVTGVGEGGVRVEHHAATSGEKETEHEPSRAIEVILIYTIVYTHITSTPLKSIHS